MVKLYKHFYPNNNYKQKKVLYFIPLFVPLWLIVLYLHFLVIFISYTLFIGKGAVINTGPLFLIFLLPSVFISGVAWIVKRFVLKKPDDTHQEELQKTFI